MDLKDEDLERIEGKHDARRITVMSGTGVDTDAIRRMLDTMIPEGMEIATKAPNFQQVPKDPDKRTEGQRIAVIGGKRIGRTAALIRALEASGVSVVTVHDGVVVDMEGCDEDFVRGVLTYGPERPEGETRAQWKARTFGQQCNSAYRLLPASPPNPERDAHNAAVDEKKAAKLARRAAKGK